MKALVAAAALCASAIAHASGMSPDPTGLWWVPQESGWGLSLVQQSNVVVAVLFVYDDAQRPAWYVATTSDTGVHLDPIGEEIFGGTLYRTSGPWFSGPFDPRAVNATAVGTLQIAYVPASTGKNIALSYSVNGVSVAKTMQPQTWGTTVGPIRGVYSGGFAFPSVPLPVDCNALADLFRAPSSFNVVDGGTLPGDQLTIGWGTGVDTVCDIHGTYVQRGRLGRLDGYLSCQPVGFPPSTDMTITLSDIDANENGFHAVATLRRSHCTYVGRFGGVRQ